MEAISLDCSQLYIIFLHSLYISEITLGCPSCFSLTSPQLFSICLFSKHKLSSECQLIRVERMMKSEKLVNTIVITISGKSDPLVLILVDQGSHFCLGCRKWQRNVTSVLTKKNSQIISKIQNFFETKRELRLQGKPPAFE